MEFTMIKEKKFTEGVEDSNEENKNFNPLGK